MSVSHLLFPCCVSVTKGEDKKVRNNGGCSSLANQIITSLVLGILVAAAAAAATYYLAYQDVMWTSIAGAGGFLLAGLITYIALRCCYGKSKPLSKAYRYQARAHKSLPPFPQQHPRKTVQEPSSQSQIKGPQIGEVLELSKQQDEEFESFSDTLSSSHAPFLSTTTLSRHLLANLDGEKPLEAQKDPANGLPIHPARLYVEMLLHPQQAGKTEILLTLLVAELVAIFEKNPDGILIYLAPLDCKTIRLLADKIENKDKEDSSAQKLYLRLRNYGEEHTEFYQPAKRQQLLTLQLNHHLGENTFYLGTSHSGEGSLFNTMAQQLSLLFEKSITEKDLRKQCQDYITHLNTVVDRLEPNNDGDNVDAPTMRSWVANARYESVNQAVDIDAKIIAELYGVTFIFHQALDAEKYQSFMEHEHIDHDDSPLIVEDPDDPASTVAKQPVAPHVDRGDQGDPLVRFIRTESRPITIESYADQERITLEAIGHPKVDMRKMNCTVAVMDKHFFPIWAVEHK